MSEGGGKRHAAKFGLGRALFGSVDAFRAVERVVLPELAQRGASRARVWVVGCSTGEDAYSIAMLLQERLADASIRVFATDTDAAALDTARCALYPAEAAEGLEPEQIARFLQRDGDSYAIAQKVRDACIFSKHHVAKDPPFSRIDLVYCEALLRRQAAERRRVLERLHFAVKHGGYVLLSPDEELEALDLDLFEIVDRRAMLLRGKTIARRYPLWLPDRASSSHARGAAVEGAEELLSSSEQLRCWNEELQLPQEELASMNEELRSTNAELNARMEELGRLHDDVENLFKSTPVATLFLDRDLRVVRFTPAATALFPLTAADLGRPIADLSPRFQGGDVSALAREVLRTLEPQEQEVRLTREDRWFLMRAHPYRTVAGSVVGVVITFAEVSALKAGERALRGAVAEREAAEEALRVSAQRKDDFLAMLSHELRNPLAPIRTALALLEQTGADDQRAARARAVIGRQVGHLARLVDDLLDVTRIERGKIQLRRAPVELGDVVRRAAEDHRSLLAAGGIDLDVGSPDAPLWVDGDATRLSQILGNLLQNAAKFTPRGGHVRVSLEATGPHAAVVRVIDDGMGIDPPMLAHLFEPFWQADGSLDRARGGLGLGLALVKALAELHGGSVEARSEGAGKGTEMVLRFPLTAPPAAVETIVAAAPEPRRVLVIEDNDDAAEMLAEVLALGGHTVAVATNGPEGLEKARESDPDVVLCDVGLPGMTGYEVARAFQEDAALRDVYLVALTGYALPDDQQRARDAGFRQHLAKPVTPEQLGSVLASVPARAR